MALDTAALLLAIKALRDIDVDNGEIDNDQMAQALTDAIDDFVKSGDVLIGGGSSAGSYKVT